MRSVRWGQTNEPQNVLVLSCCPFKNICELVLVVSEIYVLEFSTIHIIALHICYKTRKTQKLTLEGSPWFFLDKFFSKLVLSTSNV